MRDTLYFYFAICIVALALKYFIVFLLKIIAPNHRVNHEQEHDWANYIKIFILILLSIGIWYLASRSPNINDASEVLTMVSDSEIVSYPHRIK